MIMTVVLLLTAACTPTDAPCLRVELQAQYDRASRAEALLSLEQQKSALLASGLAAARQMVADEGVRADRWKEAAEKVAPKPPAFWETPIFWAVVGGVVGVGAALGAEAASAGVLGRVVQR